MTDYYGGDYSIAIDGFKAYITSFPRAEKAGEAQFNIGTCYLNDGKYQQAIDAYDTTIRTYPGTAWVAASYYKKGVALQTLGRKAEAKDAFEAAIKSGPDSDDARLASQRLKEEVK